MIRRKVAALRRLTRALPDPADYFAGRVRPADPLPDNLLLFRRRRAAELRAGDLEAALHQRWVLLLALDGTGTVELDRRPHRLRPGRALLIPPLHLHAYRLVSDRLYWLFATFEWPGHAAPAGPGPGPRSLGPAAWPPLEDLVRAWQGGEGDALLAAAHLARLLRALFPGFAAAPARLDRAAAGPARDGAGLVAAVRAAAAALGPVKLPLLARHLGLSESHLRERFRRETGLSLGRYLREARLRQAALWLREEGLSVKAAAARAGYPDPFSFSRAFRRALGRPPSALASGRPPNALPAGVSRREDSPR